MKVGDITGAERGAWGKPLEGVRILAPEQMQAMPYATQLLSHLGADVVKVEHPKAGDSGRQSLPGFEDEQGRFCGATFLRNNLNKRSLCIDLKQPEGVELFKRLVPHFDIVAENFKSGTMDRMGLGYDVLSEIDPRIIMFSVSGFGNFGSPYEKWPAYSTVAEAMGGLLEMNRRGDEPVRPLVAGALGDISTGLFGVIGVLAALHHRERTGLGQYIDMAMYDSVVAMLDLWPQLWSMGEEPPQKGAAGFGIIDTFQAKDGMFAVQISREPQFMRLAELLGKPEWQDDARFADRKNWDAHKDSVFKPAIEAWAADKSAVDACHALAGAGIAAAPSQTPAEIHADPHIQERNMLIEVPRPDGADPYLVVGNPVKMSRLQDGPVKTFPRLGEHSDEVLREVLSLSDDALAGLRERKVIG